MYFSRFTIVLAKCNNTTIGVCVLVDVKTEFRVAPLGVYFDINGGAKRVRRKFEFNWWFDSGSVYNRIVVIVGDDMWFCRGGTTDTSEKWEVSVGYRDRCWCGSNWNRRRGIVG